MFTLTHNRSDHSIEAATRKELVEVCQPTMVDSCKSWTKTRLVTHAQVIRDNLATVHAEREALDAAARKGQLEADQSNEELCIVRHDIAEVLRKICDDAHDRLQTIKELFGQSNNLASDLRWKAEAVLCHEAVRVKFCPLAARAEVAVAEVTWEEQQKEFEEELLECVRRLLDCDPTSMGLGSQEQSLAEFKALQRYTKIIQRVLKAARQDVINYCQRVKYVSSL